MNNTTAAGLESERNTTSDFGDPIWNQFAWAVFIWLFPPLCLVGTIANAVSFYVIVSNRKSFPYVTRQYLSIITASDFLILTCKASTHYLIYIKSVSDSNTIFLSPRAWGLTWCIVYDFFTYYALVGSQFFQLGLTVDRLIAVAAPMKAKVILTHRRSWVLLGLITTMSLLLPVMFVANRTWHNGNCVFRSQQYFEIVYKSVEFYFGRVFLVSALTSGTVAICLLLAWNNRTARRLDIEVNATESQQLRHKYLVRISLMLVFINLIFLATALPWTISILTEDQLTIVMGQDFYYRMLRHFNSILYVNNAVSWIAYFMGRNFREAFCRSLRTEQLRRRWQQRSGQRPSGLAPQARAAEIEDLQVETTRFLAEP